MPGAATLELELAWRTADAEGGGVDFGSIASIAVSPSGEVFVADERAQAIIVLDPGGRPVRQIGRDGEGPGEFRWVRSLGFAGDTLRAFDARLWRVTSFGRDDEVVRIDPVPSEDDFGQPADFAFGLSGLLFHLSFARFQRSIALNVGDRRFRLVRGAVTLERWTPDPSTWTAVVEAPGPEVFVDMDEGSLSDPWFARRLLWAPTPDGGAWTGDTETGALTRWAADGTRMLETRAPIEPEPVTDAERAAFHDAEDVSDEGRRALVRNRRRAVELPPTKPVLRSMVEVTGGGVLASERLPGVDGPAPLAADGSSQTRRWFLLDADGGLRAAIQMPVRLEPVVVSTNSVYAVSRDSLDVQRVEKWMIRR